MSLINVIAVDLYGSFASIISEFPLNQLGVRAKDRPEVLAGLLYFIIH